MAWGFEFKCGDCGHRGVLHYGSTGLATIINIYCKEHRKAYEITIEKHKRNGAESFLEKNHRVYYAKELKTVKTKGDIYKALFILTQNERETRQRNTEKKLPPKPKGLLGILHELKRRLIMADDEAAQKYFAPLYVTPCKECVKYLREQPNLNQKRKYLDELSPDLEKTTKGKCFPYHGEFCLNCGSKNIKHVSEFMVD